MGVRLVYLLLALAMASSEVIARGARSAGSSSDSSSSDSDSSDSGGDNNGGEDDATTEGDMAMAVLCPSIEEFFGQVNESTPIADLRTLIGTEDALAGFSVLLNRFIAALMGGEVPEEGAFLVAMMTFRNDLLLTLECQCDFKPEGAAARSLIDRAFLSPDENLLMVMMDVEGSTDDRKR